MELVQYLYSRLAQLGIGTVYGSLFEYDNSIVAAASKAGLKYARSFNEVHAGEFLPYYITRIDANLEIYSICSRRLRPRQRHLSAHNHPQLP